MATSGLLRFCAIPARLWSDAGNPELFSLARGLQPMDREIVQLGQVIARAIGLVLVPHRSIGSDERRAALAVRRLVHRGIVPQDAELASIEDVARRVGAANLAQQLQAIGQLGRRREAAKAELERRLEREPDRLATLATRASFLANFRLIAQFRNPNLLSLVADARRRGDARAQRHLGGYIWEIVERSALRPTPRDWHVRVAVLSVAADAPRPSLGSRLEVISTPNFHDDRARLLAREMPGATTTISLNPLAWIKDSRMRFAVASLADPGHTDMVDVAATPEMRSIVEVLGPDALPLPDLRARLKRPDTPVPDDLVLPLLRHLAGLGVVQLARPLPSTRVVAPSRSAQSVASRRRAAGSYVDVFQAVAGALDAGVARNFDTAFGIARRVMAAMDQDAAASRPQPPVTSHGPMPLLTAVEEKLSEPGRVGHLHSPGGWPRALTPGSPYSRLIDFLQIKAEDVGPIEISDGLMDDIGAPNRLLAWPQDCLVRLGPADAAYSAVLDDVRPAGSLDARFARFLSPAGRSAPHLAWYRTFIREIERRGKVRLVEILVPPAAAGAANAVQRPRLTRWRTGDPDARAYLVGGGASAFIPLRNIEVERSERLLVARANGTRLWPVYHATRVPIGPWLPVAETLLEASPSAIRGGRRDLRHAIDAIRAERLPAVMTTGGLLLSPAEWRVAALPWSAKEPISVRMRALATLRSDLHLPRFVLVGVKGARSLPCDLDSVRTLAVLERLAADASELRVEEMAPSVDHLWLRSGDRGRGYVSSLMLRVPFEATPADAAARMLPALLPWLD